MKKVTVGRLKKNGMMYFSQRDPASHLSGIGVRCGSMYDPPGARGMAHLVEHNLCRKSFDVGDRQLDLLIEKYMGGPDDDINVRIDRYSTFYGHDTLLRRTHMLKSFGAFASCLRDQILDAEGIRIEKAAVHQEYYVYGRDVVFMDMDDLIHQTMYKTNPARNRIACEPGDIRNLSLKEIRQFIRRHYVANNMFTIIFGPDHKVVGELTNQYFGELPQGKVPVLGSKFDVFPTLRDIRSKVVHRPGISQSHLSIGFPTNPSGHEDNDALDVIAKILAFRLRMRLREGNSAFDEGVYRALVYISRSFAHGMIYTWCASTGSEFIKRAEGIVLEECEKLSKTLVSYDEFDAAWGNLYYHYLDAFMNSPGVLAELVIDSVCNGDEELIKLNSFRDGLNKITRRKILAVANKYLTGNYAKVLVKPA